MRLTIGLCGLGAAIVSLAACSGGGSSPVSPTPTASVALVLVPGSVAQYAGTDSTVHAYPSPTGTQANYTGAYSFVATRSISNSSSGAPAPFDVNTVTTYTTTQDPGQGVTHQSATSDTFDNQATVSSGTNVTEVATTSTTVGMDETANAAGGGPYTDTEVAKTSYASPQTIGVYPLVGGATYAQPIARTVSDTTTDANGNASDVVTTFTTSSANTVNSDGSYTLTNDQSNGQVETITESSNGAATIVSNGPVFTLNDTIGVPTNSGTGYTIPVTTYKQFATAGATPAPTATTNAYTAADWYSGGALPITPFQTNVLTVKGAVTSLPSGCSGAIAEPGLVEVDTAASTLNVDASYSTTTQQRFDASGTPVCVLRTVTTNSYGLTTGVLTQTSTETYAEVLTGLTMSSSASAIAKRKAL